MSTVTHMNVEFLMFLNIFFPYSETRDNILIEKFQSKKVLVRKHLKHLQGVTFNHYLNRGKYVSH